MAFQNGYDIPEHLISIRSETLFGRNFRISEMFSLNGRDEEHGEYDHVFEWDDLTPVIWTDPDHIYEIRGCVEFDPACVVLRRDGLTVGFYMGGQAWIDPDHRGKGLGAAMIVSTIAMTRELPPVQDIGFSGAGYQAHMAALKCLWEHVPAPAPPSR